MWTNTRAQAAIVNLVFIAAIAGCTSVPRAEVAPSGLRALNAGTSGARGVLTWSMSDPALASSTNAFDAIKRLRPDFLMGSFRTPSLRHEDPALYVNDLYDGSLGGLQTIPVAEVREVRLLQPSEAFIRYGTSCRCDGGVILVLTKKPRW